MFDRVLENIGLEAPPKPKEFFLSPRELKNGLRADVGLPTDPGELISDLGLPTNPKAAAVDLGIPQLEEFSPKKMFNPR